MHHPVATIPLSTCLWLGFLMSVTIADAPVRFDLPQTLPATRIAALNQATTLPTRSFVEVQLPFSALLDTTYRGRVEELMVQIESHGQALQIADFAPRTEVTSMTQGPVAVSQSYQQDRNASIQGAAAYPAVGWVRGQAAFQDQVDIQRTYLEKPPVQVVSASGTVGRRTGVYFKFKQSPLSSLEGDHQVSMIWEVPPGWRGDLFEVTCSASGAASPNGNLKQLVRQRFLVAVYLSGDTVAAEVAKGHVVFEQRLRYAAQQYAKQIHHVNHRTPLHTVGMALDVIEPTISPQWLDEILFGSSRYYPMGDASKLPVDVRVAILDYVDQKKAMETLAKR